MNPINFDALMKSGLLPAIGMCIGIGTMLTTRYWKLIVQRFDSVRGRDWPTMSALIDVVTVTVQTEQTKYGERIVGYLATLTYFYRNPELQMGEFCRMFDQEFEAHRWADIFKGRTVMVHVDPRDPTHSVLRKESLSR